MPALLLICAPPLDPGPDADPRTWPLSLAGRASVLPLAERIRRYRPDPIVGSADPGPLETIRLLASALDAGMHTAADLHERTAPETPEAAGERLGVALDLLLKAYRREAVAVVSGPVAISHYLAGRCGVDATITERTLQLPSYVAIDRAGFTITEVAGSI